MGRPSFQRRHDHEVQCSIDIRHIVAIAGKMYAAGLFPNPAPWVSSVFHLRDLDPPGRIWQPGNFFRIPQELPRKKGIPDPFWWAKPSDHADRGVAPKLAAPRACR